jgi:hypothetical protein
MQKRSILATVETIIVPTCNILTLLSISILQTRIYQRLVRSVIHTIDVVMVMVMVLVIRDCIASCGAGIRCPSPSFRQPMKIFGLQRVLPLLLLVVLLCCCRLYYRR